MKYLNQNNKFYKIALILIILFNFTIQIIVHSYILINNNGEISLSPDAELYLDISHSVRYLKSKTTGIYHAHQNNIDIGELIMPGYPFLISPFFENLHLISLFQTLLFSLALIFLFKLLYNKYLAFFALFTTVWIIISTSWSYHNQALIESPTISFLLIVIYYLDKYFKDYNTKDIILFSVYFGILIALNNRYIFHYCGILPFLFLLKYFERRIKIKHLFYSFLIVTAIMAPWHIRQYIHYGEFILFSPINNSRYENSKERDERMIDYLKEKDFEEYLKDSLNHPLKDNPKELEEGRKLYLERVKQYAEDQRKINEGIIKIKPPKLVYEPATKRLKEEEKELLASNDKVFAKKQAKLLEERKSLVGLNENQSNQKKDKTTDINTDNDLVVEYRTKPENNSVGKNETKLNTKNNIKPDISIPKKTSDKNINQQIKNKEADTSLLLSNIDSLIIKDNNIHSNVIKEEIKPSLQRKDEQISVAERKNLESRKVESSKKEDAKSITSNIKEQKSSSTRGEERKTTLSKREEELAINERRELESKGISSGRQEDTKSITGKQQVQSQSIARKEEIKPSLQRKDEQISVAERKNLESRKVESSKKEDAKSITSNIKEQKSTSTRGEERKTTLSKREEELAINERKELENNGISSGRQEDTKSITGKQQEISQSIARKEEIKPSLQRKDEQSVAERKNLESRKVESSKKEDAKSITSNLKDQRTSTSKQEDRKITLSKREEELAINVRRELESKGISSSRQEDTKSIAGKQQDLSHSGIIKEEIKPSLQRKEEQTVAERKNLESRKVESSKKEDTKSISSNMKEQNSSSSKQEERNTKLSKREEELAINERKELESKGISSGRQEDTKSITGKQQDLSHSGIIKEEIKPSLQRKEEQTVAERKNLESRKVESSKKEDAKTITSNMKEQKSTSTRGEERKTTLSKREEELAINERKKLESKGISSGRQEDTKSITGKQQVLSQSIARKEEIKPVIERQNTESRTSEARKESGIGKQEVSEKKNLESRKLEPIKKEENKLITENRKETGIGNQELGRKEEQKVEKRILERRKIENIKKEEQKLEENLIVKLDTQFIIKKKVIPYNISSNLNKATLLKKYKTDTLLVIQKTLTDTSTNPKIKKKKPVISQDTISTFIANNLFWNKHKEEVIEFEDDKMFISFEGLKVKQLRTSDFENELEFRKFNDQRIQKMVPTYDEIVNALLNSQPKFGETPEKLYQFINDFSFEKYKKMVEEKSIPNRFTIVWDRFVDHFVFYRSDFLLNPQWDPRIRYPSYYRNTIYLLLDIIMMPLIFINIIPLLIGIYKRDWLIVSLAVLVFLHILLHSLVASGGPANDRYRLTIYPAWITFAVYGYDQITRYIIYVYKNRVEYKQRLNNFFNRKQSEGTV